MLRRHRYVFGRFDCKAGFRGGSEPCAEAHFSCLSVLSGSCEGPSTRFVPAFDEDDVVDSAEVDREGARVDAVDGKEFIAEKEG